MADRRSLSMAVAAALLCLLALAGSARALRQSAVQEQGRAIYNFRCYFCHGYAGDARTLASTYLSPKPRDFTAGGLGLDDITRAVLQGRPGTAMKSFKGILSDREMQAVAAFVEAEFVRRQAPNTAYHTAANGWPDHERHAAAFPFARGQVALDAATDTMSPELRAGRQLYLSACVSCHDRAHVQDEGPVWTSRPVSFPRVGFVPGQAQEVPVDAVSSASVYAKHEVVPRVSGLTAAQQQGERLFQANCAFCHGGDGTGKNWIGQFMEPKARDLTQYTASSMPAGLLRQRIREGLPGTSMPAWQHVLQPAEVDAVAAYVSRVFFRDGSTRAR